MASPAGLVVRYLETDREQQHVGDAARGTVTLAPLCFRVLSWHREDSEYKAKLGARTGDAYTLRVVVEVVGHSVPEGHGVRLTFTSMFWADVPEQKALRELLREAMAHEADECILVDGKRVYDPHADERSK